jgi:hypothetical protein
MHSTAAVSVEAPGLLRQEESQSQRLMNLSDASLLRCVEDELMPVAQLEVSNDKPRTWLASASSARRSVEGAQASGE